MSIDDRKHAYMNRMLKVTVLLATLGSIALYFGINYLSSVMTNALDSVSRAGKGK
ncbi:MAG: hypothetical protein K2Y32_03235 [Candidatus Obscuribacterales bacterium]|nr:hypothetical protein [Candidatus Obscuribacterales bacterium]